jgi:uncharacterized membrane protein
MSAAGEAVGGAAVAVVGLAGPLPAADSADSAAVGVAEEVVGPVQVGKEMRTKEFLNRLDNKRIVEAIASAETKTSGEIRVFIRRGEAAGDPLEEARKEFAKLGMEKTSERNAILIFVAPRAQKFAVVGDEGVHQKCGTEFWEQLVATMRAHFKREEFTDALVEAIESAGQLLAEHFPRRDDDRNELPDAPLEEH